MTCKYNHRNWCGITYPRVKPYCPCADYEEGAEEYLSVTPLPKTRLPQEILDRLKKNPIQLQPPTYRPVGKCAICGKEVHHIIGTNQDSILAIDLKYYCLDCLRPINRFKRWLKSMILSMKQNKKGES